jgi:UDP-N-acetylglucosamine acyltransferase
MPTVHPTAIVDPGADLADRVEIGPYCVVESDVTLGPGTCLRSHAIIRRFTTLGADNLVDSFCVLGGNPQDVKFDPSSETYLRIGDGNLFREHVTISRATGHGEATIVGNQTFWMAGSHAGHNVTVKDHATLVNGTAIGGHGSLGRRAILGGGAKTHQFCWVGEGAMIQGNAPVTQHIPPFSLYSARHGLVGLNVVGLRRHPDLTDTDRREIREAFDLLYRRKLPIGRALEDLNEHDWGPAAGRFVDFIRRAYHADPPFNRPLARVRRD